MRIYFMFATLAVALLVHSCSVNGQIKKIWLTHRTNTPTKIVINWESSQPGNSQVFYRTGSSSRKHVVKEENVTLHHIEIPLEQKNTIYYYEVQTGDEKSPEHSFKGYPRDELRIVVVGNWGFAENPDFTEMLKDDPHLLLTCGDNIPGLHESCGEGKKECVEPFMNLVASAPDLFRSIPFMPAIGNHDKQIRDRGSRPPKERVYDTTAAAFKSFVELPGDEWKWMFRIPEFKLSLIALDLNHLSDLGTTYQSSHDYRIIGDQFLWYRKLMGKAPKGFIVTISNERSAVMRKVEDGAWNKLMRKGTAVIAGFGHYLERAEVDGFPYFNTSLKFGDVYPDPFSKITRGMPGYILLTFRKNEPMIAEIKFLDGTVIDRTEWAARK